MDTQQRGSYGLVLLDQSLSPIFVNAQAHVIFSWLVRKRSYLRLPDGELTRSGLPCFVNTLACELLKAYWSVPPTQTTQRTILSKNIKVYDEQFRLYGGVCSMSDSVYFLITLQIVKKEGRKRSRSIYAGVPLMELTLREEEVVTFLAKGWTNRVIAKRMAISVHTVKDHLKAIRAKTGAKNRTQILTKLSVT